jgi:hypothetical protein
LVEEYLNTYVKPHTLLSISMFEQSHGSYVYDEFPDLAKTIQVPLHAQICHNDESDGIEHIFQVDDNGKIDSCSVYSGCLIPCADFDKGFATALRMVGDGVGFKICAATRYRGSKGAIYIVQWPRYIEEQLRQENTC